MGVEERRRELNANRVPPKSKREGVDEAVQVHASSTKALAPKAKTKSAATTDANRCA